MVYLVVSIDVEEEGLFSGAYPTNPGVENLKHLEKLEFLTRDFGIPLTLLTAHSVANSPWCVDTLKLWREERGAEIGAHLHHWSTPPIVEQGRGEPMLSDDIPMDVLREKFHSLLDSLERNFGHRPASFRMGRWDFGKQVETLLPELGFTVDSSASPLRYGPPGTDRFLTPVEPWWLPCTGSQGQRVLEVPITVLPVWGPLARMARAGVAPFSHRTRRKLLAKFKAVAAMGIQPVWFPLFSMKMAARAHINNGGSVLCMFFHSSELMPGQSPHFPDEASVQAMLLKIRRFIEYVRGITEVRGATLGQMRELLSL